LDLDFLSDFGLLFDFDLFGRVEIFFPLGDFGR